MHYHIMNCGRGREFPIISIMIYINYKTEVVVIDIKDQSDCYITENHEEVSHQMHAYMYVVAICDWI